MDSSKTPHSYYNFTTIVITHHTSFRLSCAKMSNLKTSKNIRKEYEVEKLILIMVKNYTKMMDYCMAETKWGFKHAVIAFLTPFIIGLIIIKFNETIALKMVLFSFVIFGLLCLLMYLNSGTKFIHFISKGKYDNPRQLLQSMTHLSYIYGVIISLNIEYIIVFIVFDIQLILEQEIHFPNLEILFCVIFFAFSFFYFTFHLYVNPENLEISFVKQRLQLYTVWGTTVSFILLISNESGGIKIFITGILLDYLWINYFITDKENKLKKKDI